MKKFISIFTITIAIIYTIYYMHFGGLIGIKSALSTVGLEHHLLFRIWGAGTYLTLAINVIIALGGKYKFHYPLLLIAMIGMTLTLTNDFLYNDHKQYWAHCIGTLTFSVVMGILIVCSFIVLEKFSFAIISGGVLIIDLMFLLVYKEGALIEVVPIFTGYILLLINNLSKEKEKIGINK